MELLYFSAESIAKTAHAVGWARSESLGYTYNALAEDTLVRGTTMVQVYYDLCLQCERIPTQKEFIERYEWANREWFKVASSEQRSGMLFRVARAWPSFVAEHHLFSLFVESGICRTAIKTSDDDVTKGTDMILRGHRSDERIGIASFTDTVDGWAKAHRKQRKPECKRLCVPLTFPTAERVGPNGWHFHLYTQEHVAVYAVAIDHMILCGWEEATSHLGQIVEGLAKAS